jgi:hypothetical protein
VVALVTGASLVLLVEDVVTLGAAVGVAVVVVVLVEVALLLEGAVLVVPLEAAAAVVLLLLVESELFTRLLLLPSGVIVAEWEVEPIAAWASCWVRMWRARPASSRRAKINSLKLICFEYPQ